MTPIHIAKMAVSAGCGLGGQYVAPFIMPLINPGAWSSCLVLLLICSTCAPTTPINSGDFKSTSRNVCIVHYISCVLVLCCVFGAVCKVDSAVPF
jgi:hypothetical protein